MNRRSWRRGHLTGVVGALSALASLFGVWALGEGLLRPPDCPLQMPLEVEATARATWGARVREDVRVWFAPDDLRVVVRKLGDGGDVVVLSAGLGEAIATGNITLHDVNRHQILDAGDLLELANFPATTRLSLDLYERSGNLVGLTGGCA